MTLSHVHKARLLKLAEHLESNKRGHKKFDFSVVATGDPKVTCGTAGCALGECPIAFPRHFKFSPPLPASASFEAVLRKGQPRASQWWGPSATFLAAHKFFGLTDEEASHLFTPTSQCPEVFGGHLLGMNATPKAVAKNIRAFLKKLEK